MLKGKELSDFHNTMASPVLRAIASAPYIEGVNIFPTFYQPQMGGYHGITIKVATDELKEYVPIDITYSYILSPDHSHVAVLFSTGGKVHEEVTVQQNIPLSEVSNFVALVRNYVLSTLHYLKVDLKVYHADYYHEVKEAWYPSSDIAEAYMRGVVAVYAIGTLQITHALYSHVYISKNKCLVLNTDTVAPDTLYIAFEYGSENHENKVHVIPEAHDLTKEVDSYTVDVGGKTLASKVTAVLKEAKKIASKY